jgi:hypothetical protein
MLHRPLNGPDTSDMPIGSLCRACGAPLRPDLEWCGTCYTRVTSFAARPPMHQAGAYVGSPRPTARTSRWRSGPTTLGPIGRVVATLCLFALFPWGGTVGVSAMAALQLWFLIGWVVLAVVVLRSVWAPTRIAHDAPEGWAERFRREHPLLGRRMVLSRGSRRIVLVVAAGCAVASWLGLEDLGRYVWGAVALSAALALFLTTWNDL